MQIVAPMHPRLSLKIAAVLLAALSVASCGAGKHAKRYLGDADPNSGVARAHRLPIQGIDVAKYQGDINWPQVRRSGIRFAYLKVSEGGDHVDSKFYDNWEQAAAAGVPRGAYHFMYWCRTWTEQAVWFTTAVPQDQSALPPVLDLEWNNESKTCPTRPSRDDALQGIRVMLSAMEQHTGKRPVIYTDINFYRDILQGEFPDYQYWLRSVSAEPKDRYAGQPWAVWQYTATGRVAGVPGSVDRNAFNGSESAWRQWLKVNGVPGWKSF